MVCRARTNRMRLGKSVAAGCLAVFWLFLVLPFEVFVASASETAEQLVHLANDQLRIAMHRENGSLQQIHDPATKHDYLTGLESPKAALWSLKVRAENRDVQDVLVTPGAAGSFRWEQGGGPPAATRLIWRDFGFSAAPDLRVEVDVRLDDRVPSSVWQLTIRSPGSLTVDEIRFPIVPGIAPQDDERLAVPVWMGQQRGDPRKWLAGGDGKGRRIEWPYPGQLSLQCLVYYRDRGPGLFISCRDASAQRKAFAVWSDNVTVGVQGSRHATFVATAMDSPRLNVEVVHYPEPRSEPQDRIVLGYPVVLGTFCGDWLTAAERYRDWATQQAWARESRLQRGDVPDWVLHTGLWVWNRGRSPLVLPPAAALQKELGLPVSVFWHWWHGCPYDTGFPEYLPPREGTEAFRGALEQAHRQGLRALVYMNQRLWGMTTESWTGEDAATWAVKGPDGKIRPEVYNTFTQQPCASMCMGTLFWRSKYAGLAERAVRDLGVDGIYMDQACSSLPCYDPRHGHPLGAGSYWTEGFRMLAEDIRRRCAGRQPIALAGEGCGEAWLPHLDLMLTLEVSRERYAAIQDGWEVIPFFHAVYHPFAILYGNYSSLTIPPYDDLWPAEHAPPKPLELLDRKYSGQFYLEQARAFVWGQQPTIANFLPSQLDERRQEIDYVLHLAKLRNLARKYLIQGVFLRAPTIDAPTVSLDFSRLSIYAGQKDRVQSFQKTCPAALAAAWLAPDGDVGIVLTSVVERPLRLSLALSPEEHRLPPIAQVFRMDDAGCSAMGQLVRDRPILTVELPPLGATILELKPGRS